MVRARKLSRFLVLAILGAVVTFVYYTTRSTSSLSEDGDPQNGKDANGNTKTPDLAPGVASVIDTHRIATHDAFTFPIFIHQTAQRMPVTPASLSWYYANPGEEHIFYDDKQAKDYVTKYASKDVSRIYTQLADPVARADLFRYIVLAYTGGVYSDVDTTTLCPINAWIPSDIDETRVNLVVGIEVDAPAVASASEIEAWGWASNFQFVQWTIMARPGHPALKSAIEEVVTRVKKLAEKKGTTVSDLRMTNMEIIRTTGPSAFTTAVLKYLNLDPKDPTPLRGITSPKQIDDVLVLPVTSFAPNQRHSNSKSVKYVENIPEVLVMHGFQATRTWADSLTVWLLTAAAKAKIKVDSYKSKNA